MPALRNGRPSGQQASRQQVRFSDADSTDCAPFEPLMDQGALLDPEPALPLHATDPGISLLIPGYTPTARDECFLLPTSTGFGLLIPISLYLELTGASANMPQPAQSTSPSSDDPEQGETPHFATDPPPYPNLTPFERYVALVMHSRSRSEVSEDSLEGCECGECHVRQAQTPAERPRASPDHKYKPSPPYSAPPDIDRPEAHQFSPLSTS